MPVPGENAMSRLPKEKRDKFILTVLGTAILLAGLYFGVISPQLANLRALKDQKAKEQKNATDVDTSIRNAKTISTQLSQRSSELKSNEQDMASGDAYAWMVNALRQFQQGYSVEISQVSQPSYPDTSLFPHYPYKQIQITIGGTAYYHDLGKFVADFENRFQHMRIQDVTIEPSQAPSSGDRDKLNFRMEIVALVNSSAHE
jgi:Tfp pilus assembly protein PilO